MRSNKPYLITIVVLVILLIFKSCTGTPNSNSEEGKVVDTDTVIVYDIKRERHIDTVTVFHDSIRIKNVTITKVNYDTIRNLAIYESPFEDPLISGSVYSEVDGVLVKQEFTYIPKFPKYVNITDSIFITKNKTVTNTIVEPNKLKVFVGLEIGGNKATFNMGPKVSLLTKKDILIDYNYDVINKTHNIGFNKKLKFK